MQIIEDLDELE